MGKSTPSLCFIDFGDCHNPDTILLDAGRTQLALSDNAYLSIKLYFFFLSTALCVVSEPWIASTSNGLNKSKPE